MRQGFCRLYQLVFTDNETKAKEVEIGYARVFTGPDLELESLSECDNVSGDVETVMAAALLRDEDSELWGLPSCPSPID